MTFFTSAFIVQPLIMSVKVLHKGESFFFFHLVFKRKKLPISIHVSRTVKIDIKSTSVVTTKLR